MNPQWLPELILMEDFAGDWGSFFAAVYEVFRQDFEQDKPVFRGKRLGLKRHPEYDGKSATFWHMISEGTVEDDRVPDIRRCERIGWPRPIIENSEDAVLKVWAEPRGKNQRIHLWLESEGYLVVLDDRGEYILPWTAFYIEREHQRTKYTKRWNRYKNNGV
ncbi:hypothetical protein DC094_11235 [Pelagibaculum spongiae]|uniref:Phage P1-related protein n=1 Tax=Pelagibaculum spongiae TaxID=2080658 RepID=A0A2V1GXP8_9GAMM|nr:hypothetical protein DC094_11235 [Pelagibaculum spongiae]